MSAHCLHLHCHCVLLSLYPDNRPTSLSQYCTVFGRSPHAIDTVLYSVGLPVRSSLHPQRSPQGGQMSTPCNSAPFRICGAPPMVPRRHVCTWKGRMLYWAVLLVKYSRNALEDPGAIRSPEPSSLCRHQVNLTAIKRPRLHRELPQPPESWPPGCGVPGADRVAQPPCAYFCRPGQIIGAPQIWVPSSVVDIVPRSTLGRFERL